VVAAIETWACFLFDIARLGGTTPSNGANRMSTHPTPLRHTVTLHPSRVTVQAIATAAAIIACADGCTTREERRSLLRFLRYHGVLARHTRAECLAMFDGALDEISALDLQELCDAADCLRPVAGTPGAHLVALAAAHTALADGITWPQEIALLQVIRNRIGLDTNRGDARRRP
jgi:tellurite resistance protein